MGETSVVFGRISTYSREELRHDLDIITTLPSEEDGYALFTREMFNRNTLNGKMNYTFGFARSYKNIEHDWENWMFQFEELIRKLKWDSINVILETEILGTHQFFWQRKNYRGNPEVKIRNDYGLIEKDEWYFGKGHRNFWGMESSYGWENESEEVRTLKILAETLDKNLENIGLAALEQKDKTDLRLKVTKASFKGVLSKLLKMYIDEAEKQTKSISKSNYDVKKVFSNESPFNIISMELEKDVADTDWINHFVDKLIDQKGNRNDRQK